jgi:hypothetical protein
MWTGTAFQVSAIELVDALEGNETTFLVVKSFRDFFPCLALPPLLTDEFDVGFQPAVKRQAAAGFFPFRPWRPLGSFRIHRQ